MGLLTRLFVAKGFIYLFIFELQIKKRVVNFFIVGKLKRNKEKEEGVVIRKK